MGEALRASKFRMKQHLFKGTVQQFTAMCRLYERVSKYMAPKPLAPLDDDDKDDGERDPPLQEMCIAGVRVYTNTYLFMQRVS